MAEIEIIEDEYRNHFKVNYLKSDFEIEGTLKPYQTGRGVDYEFEPDYFSDSLAEDYYDAFNEDIIQEIMSKFYELN